MFLQKQNHMCPNIMPFSLYSYLYFYVRNTTTEKMITESVEPNSSSNFILIKPVRSYSSNNTTSLLQIWTAIWMYEAYSESK